MAFDTITIGLLYREQEEVESAQAALKDFSEFSILPLKEPGGGFDTLLAHWSFSRILQPVDGQKHRFTELPLVYYGPRTYIRLMLSMDCGDYITYPFTTEETASRLFRVSPKIITFCGTARTALSGNALCGDKNSVNLSIKETLALLLLAASSPEPVSRTVLVQTVFPGICEGSRYPDMIISSLRKKIQFAAQCSSSPIQSSWGYGYRI
jgi:hypothetical protein